MNSIILNSAFKKLKLNNFGQTFSYARRLYSYSYQPPDEYAEKAEYPEILDLSKDAEWKRKEIKWHEEIKNVTTIEGKLLKVNMPRYYGWNCTQLNDKVGYTYNCLPFFQHWTRTLIKEGIPPGYYKGAPETEDKLVAELRGLIEDSIVFQHQGYR